MIFLLGNGITTCWLARSNTRKKDGIMKFNSGIGIMTKEAIILAGGLGTRLREVVKDIPKPMAKVKDKPFLEYVFNYLYDQNIKNVVLSVGYKYEIIKKHFKDSYRGIKIRYSIEEEPLGTGGAIVQSLQYIDSEECFIINGDTLFEVPLKELYSFHKSKNTVLSMALKPLKNTDRYGLVTIDKNNKIINFQEKIPNQKGLINGGVSILHKKLIEKMPLKFSWEKDFIEKQYQKHDFYGLPIDKYFVDMGIPKDYFSLEYSGI